MEIKEDMLTPLTTHWMAFEIPRECAESIAVAVQWCAMTSVPFDEKAVLVNNFAVNWAVLYLATAGSVILVSMTSWREVSTTGPQEIRTYQGSPGLL